MKFQNVSKCMTHTISIKDNCKRIASLLLFEGMTFHFSSNLMNYKEDHKFVYNYTADHSTF